MNINPAIQLNIQYSRLQALETLHAFFTVTLSTVDRESPEYGALFDALALGRLDLLGHAVERYISLNHNRISLSTRANLLEVAKVLKQKQTHGLNDGLGRAAEFQKALSF